MKKIFLFLTFILITGCVPKQAEHGMNHGSTATNGEDPGEFLPGMGIDVSTLPEAQPTQILEMADGESVDIKMMLVRKTVNGKTFPMYAYNGQIPGPLIKAKKGSTFYVNIVNNIELPSTSHWHGLRLKNAFDGVPGITQDPIQPGSSFRYEVTVPDSGMFWYHPHVREDIQQDMGLYGNILVETDETENYAPVNQEEALVVDDILLDDEGFPEPYGKDFATRTMMGRFGNTMLLNSQTDYVLDVQQGSVVRFYLTNVASVRTFKLTFGGAKIKLIASDVSAFDNESFIDSLTISPGERYTVDVLFEDAGTFDIRDIGGGANRLMGKVRVQGPKVAQSYENEFEALQTHQIYEDIDWESYLDTEPDKSLRISFSGTGALANLNHQMSGELEEGIEWEDTMPEMNAMSNEKNMNWLLVDDETGKTNMDIQWEFQKGDLVKIRLTNDDESMQHPMHFHGQRFLVLSDSYEDPTDRAWKDTYILRNGETVDILLEATNPGNWMFHCHISEHIQDGMMSMFRVNE